MKLRHAAALALIGWLLMYPPDPLHDMGVEYWYELGRYDTLQQCRAALKRAREEAKYRKRLPGSGTGEGVPGTMLDYLGFDQLRPAQCHSTSEPEMIRHQQFLKLGH